MALNLAELCEPSTTAVVCQEMQKGIVGPISIHRDLADLAGEEVIPNTVRIVERAREVGSLVVHTPTIRRPDDIGSGKNTRIFKAARKLGTPLEPGGEGAEVLDEIGVGPKDLELPRLHGLGPMHDAGLDSALRNEGVKTIVATGVSVNLGILELTIAGASRGYQMVVVRDAVAGVPKDYADAVIENTLWLAATIVTTEELLGAWGGK